MSHKKTGITELRSFYGVCYARGAQNTNLTVLNTTWSESSFGHPVYDACLSRHRYSFLRHYITFDDMNTRETRWRHDRFAAMKDFFMAANKKFSKHLQPSEYLALGCMLHGQT